MKGSDTDYKINTTNMLKTLKEIISNYKKMNPTEILQLNMQKLKLRTQCVLTSN